MYTLDTILEKLRRHKPALLQKYPISRIGVFGSYARGEATEKSDIDIAVELNGPMGLNFVAMANEIEDLFGIKVDVPLTVSNAGLRRECPLYPSWYAATFVVPASDSYVY